MKKDEKRKHISSYYYFLQFVVKERTVDSDKIRKRLEIG